MLLICIKPLPIQTLADLQIFTPKVMDTIRLTFFSLHSITSSKRSSIIWKPNKPTFMFRQLLDLHHCSYSHLQMRSVERVFKFIDLPSEEPKPRLGQRKASTLVIENPEACTDTCWPSHGQMDIHNLTVKYTEAGHAVLKNLSFNVEGGQKVCVGASE